MHVFHGPHPFQSGLQAMNGIVNTFVLQTVNIGSFGVGSIFGIKIVPVRKGAQGDIFGWHETPSEARANAQSFGIVVAVIFALVNRALLFEKHAAE